MSFGNLGRRRRLQLVVTCRENIPLASSVSERLFAHAAPSPRLTLPPPVSAVFVNAFGPLCVCYRSVEERRDGRLSMALRVQGTDAQPEPSRAAPQNALQPCVQSRACALGANR
eukprot:6130475-Pleurochrysis_carterae.AAC.4